jgi:hypothetical protein
MRPRTLYAVAAAATAVLLIALAVDLLHASHHRTGANGRIRSTVVNMPPGGRLCQPNQLVEAGTGRVRFFAHGVTPVTGPLDVTIDSGGRVVSRGVVRAVPPAGPQQLLVATVQPVPRRLTAATVCIVNRGAGMQIFGEATTQPGATASQPAAAQPSPYVIVNLDFQRADEASWLSFAPTVADRYGLVKATFFGAWTFWVAMIALLALAIGTIWWVARVVSR